MQTANFAKENPGLIAGLFLMAAPGIITAPFMGVAGVLGFTPAGIAASKGTLLQPFSALLPSHFM